MHGSVGAHLAERLPKDGHRREGVVALCKLDRDGAGQADGRRARVLDASRRLCERLRRIEGVCGSVGESVASLNGRRLARWRTFRLSQRFMMGDAPTRPVSFAHAGDSCGVGV